MKTIRIVGGAIFMLLGLATLMKFEATSRLFLFLSPDGMIMPLMMLFLKLCLVSLGCVGLVLIFYNQLIRLLGLIDIRLSGLSRKSFLIYALPAGFLLRLAVVLFMPFHLWMDYDSYDDLGWQWATKGGYYNGEHLTAYWPPGFPFFLSRLYLVFGHQPVLGTVANIFFGLAIALFTYLIIRRIWGERVSRWAMLIMIFFPSQVFFTNLLASEMLFTSLFLASILICVMLNRELKGKWYYALLAGILLGLAALTRSVSKMYLLLVVPFWLLQTHNIKRTVRFTVLALVGFSLLVVPWMIRNHDAVGSATINTNTGINFFIGNQPGSGMGYNQYAADEYDVNDPLREAYVDSAAWHRAWDYIFEKPGAFLARGVMKVGLYYAIDFDPLDYGLHQAANESKTNY